MTEEEAIKQLKSLINTMNLNNTINVNLFKKDKESMETLLSANEKKDKIIDLMAEEIKKHWDYKKQEGNCPIYLQISDCYAFENCKECVKQYFEKQVEIEQL